MAISVENLQNAIDRLTSMKEVMKGSLAAMVTAQHEESTLIWLNGELSGFSFALDLLLKSLETHKNY